MQVKQSGKGAGSSLNKTAFERSVASRIRLHVLPTDRFKTFAVSAFIGARLQEDTVTPTAVIPFVLRRGTESLPETKAFREKLDELYGAGFGFDVTKRGDNQIVQFKMDIIEDRYVGEKGSLLREGLRFLGEAIAKPALEDAAFVRAYVEAEKKTVREKLEAIVNDKIRYAAERCMQEMCRNEPYRLHPLGRIDAIDAIGPDNLYVHYRQWLQQAPIDLYVVGNTTLAEVEAIVGEVFPNGREASPGYSQAVQAAAPAEPRTVVERLDVSQGKLNMGLRAGVTYADDAYPAALLYNGIFGGYPHAKLFINVREKASLAYYASSRLDGHKGIVTIQSGIEIGNYDKAVAIIGEQLDAMRQGRISELELAQTKAMLGNHLREIQDSAFEIIGFDFNSVLSGKERSAESLIRDIERTGVDEIVRVAEGVKLDTIYFLRDRKEG